MTPKWLYDIAGSFYMGQAPFFGGGGGGGGGGDILEDF